MVIAVTECDELSPRAHVDSGERRSGPQAGDTGFGNTVEMKALTELFQQTFIEQELVQGTEARMF